MMKSKDLILRKGELREQRKDILHKINGMVVDMRRKDLERFIRSGDPGQADGKQLRLLQRKRQHLINLEGSLNLEITKSRKSERLKALGKLNKKIEILNKKRKGSLYQKYLHYQEKIKQIQQEDRAIRDESIDLRNQLHQFNQRAIPLSFRLPEIEKVIKQNYFAAPDKLRETAERDYRNNKLCLEADTNSETKDELIRGYQIQLDRDSGKIVELKQTTCDRSLAKRNPKVMREVKNEE